jgi:hypothetical protein
MKEACGVVGIVAPGRSVAHLCFDALFALQHRGQESAGMATFQNEQITVVKDNGLVSAVFAESTLASARWLARDRSHALLHLRIGQLDRRPAGLPLGGRVGLCARPQWEPHQHLGTRRRGRHRVHLDALGLGPRRGTTRARSGRWSRARRGARRRARTRRRRILDGHPRVRSSARRPGPLRFSPTLSRSTRHRRRARRVDRRLGVPGARRRGGHLRARDRTRRDGHHHQGRG